MREEMLPHSGKPLQRLGDQPGHRELQRLGGEHSSQFVAGTTERNQHRGPVPPCCSPQPEICTCWCVHRLCAETHASEDRLGERTGVSLAKTT